MEFITNLLSNDWVSYITAAIAVFSAIAAILPTPAPGTPMATVYKAVDWIALNVGKAKDTGEEKVDTDAK